LGFSQALISDNEVLVYINDIPQTLGVDYTVEPYAGDGRHVVFATTPDVGDRILISVTTNTQARITGGTSLLIDTTQGIIPVAGDIITVTTWNDTRQQELLTSVYVGPVSSGAVITEGYDDTDFDSGTLNDEPGSFDDAEGVMNHSLQETGGSILLISQFTLYAATKKGNRPSYIAAAKPEIAIPIYEQMILQLTKDLGKPIATGQFGADMKVALINDGPVTILMDSKNRD
jgi:D-tyrosyl-tRNA(Tyr) deacylase